MLRLALLVIAVGAASAAAQPKEPEVEVPRPVLPFDIRRAATEDRIDVSDVVRWPLPASAYLTLEPTYPIAAVFAQDSTWLDLCGLGVQNRIVPGMRSAYLDYLRAWCEVARHDTDAALVHMRNVLRSNVKGLADAVRRDLANILVDAGNAQMAHRALLNAKIDEIAVDDLLAASFADLNKRADADWFNDAALARTVQTITARCQRLARRVVIADKADRFSRLKELQPHIKYHDCKLLLHELTCWNGGSCTDYINEHGIDPELAAIVDVYAAWPSGPASARRWIMIADEAAGYLGRAGADILAITALEGAMRATTCTGDQAAIVSAAARKILASPYRERSFDARVGGLINTPGKLCAKP
jgi:hypothetical protein